MTKKLPINTLLKLRGKPFKLSWAPGIAFSLFLGYNVEYFRTKEARSKRVAKLKEKYGNSLVT